MSNSKNPIGSNGSKELKVKKGDDFIIDFKLGVMTVDSNIIPEKTGIIEFNTESIKDMKPVSKVGVASRDKIHKKIQTIKSRNSKLDEAR